MDKKLILIGLICILIGAGAVAAISIFKVPSGNVFLGLMLVICPLTHFLMMGLMGHGNHDRHVAQENESQIATKTLQAKTLQDR
jgi:hypothetical protein